MQPRILMRVLCVVGLSLAALGCSTSSDPTETSQIPTEPAAGDCETTGCSANEVCVVEGSEPECLCDDGFHRDLSGSCISDATLTSCTSSGVDCTEGQPSGTDASCDPVDGCVYSCLPDTCVVDGQCIPSGVVAPDNPCLSCQPDIDREAYTVLSGATCDDGDACTYGDRCGGQGICTGTPITCEDDAEQCGASKSCNGTDTCTVTYPPLGTSCNDGELCTFDDACDGQGACSGTEVVCENDLGTCGATRACNGTSDCEVAFPGAEAQCDDNDLCTFSDACDGAGGCSGTPVVCEDEDTVCGAVASCNGSSTCSLTFTPTGFSCDDGNACTLGDVCDGSGACQSGSSLDCGPGGTCSAEGCVCSAGYTGDACRECDEGYLPEGDDCVLAPEPLPDFALLDVNSASETFNQTIRFEDFRGRISAWYFFHST